jgi:hypothetical protein
MIGPIESTKGVSKPEKSRSLDAAGHYPDDRAALYVLGLSRIDRANLRR